MKKITHIVILVALTALTFFGRQSDLGAVRRRGDYFTRPQLGLWFGPTTPLFELNEELDSTIGIGLFGRINTPYKPLKIGFDYSFQYYESLTVNTLRVQPLYGSLQYRLPIPSPLNFLIKAGGGSTQLYMEPDKESRWDPTAVVGYEMSFPAGKVINIGLRIDYLMLIEQHLPEAEYNGNILNIGLSLFFNI